MNWESYFAELEGQFADDAAAERAAVAVESERLRLSRLDLATRVRAATADHARVQLTTLGSHHVAGTLSATGADWCGVDTGNTVRCVRFEALRALSFAADGLQRRLMPVPTAAMAGRATFGYVLRGWARSRTPVMIHLADASVATGTIDRAGADHCDLALHDAHVARRDAEVSRIVVVPFAAIAMASPLSR